MLPSLHKRFFIPSSGLSQRRGRLLIWLKDCTHLSLQNNTVKTMSKKKRTRKIKKDYVIQVEPLNVIVEKEFSIPVEELKIAKEG